MYKIQIILLFAFLFTLFSCQNKPKGEIHFVERNWQAVKKEAGEKKKIIFVDAYASWCGPCKMMDSKTFKDKEVADFFNENFINCHF
jgi:thioredoxin 1